jgi:hypothetical protein
MNILLLIWAKPALFVIGTIITEAGTSDTYLCMNSARQVKMNLFKTPLFPQKFFSFSSLFASMLTIKLVAGSYHFTQWEWTGKGMESNF